jgi:dihydroorotase
MDTLPSLVLGNVTLPSGRVADVSLENGRVAHVGARRKKGEILDCTGLFVLPAATDMHVHMRGGVQSAKEDWRSGSMSALAGGVTVVVDQPNTIPPVTTPGSLRDRVRDAQETSYCSFAINSGVTSETPLESMWQAGAMAFGETFCAPSSYGDAISEAALRPALGRIHALGALATIHAETIGAGEDPDLVSHDRVRSPEGELRAVNAVGRLNTARCRLHFCHLSTRRSVGAAPGSVEVTPHHLFLSLEDFDATDPSGKVNPPLRTEKERKQLWGAWDRIDVIASDHAPHTREEKAQPFPLAPSGICGVETMVPLLLARVIDGKISLQSVIEKTSSRPAEILGIPPAGFRPGDRADFSLSGKIPGPVTPETLHSKCGWTPFEGHMAIFPSTVIRGGSVVYHEGEFVKVEPVWFPGRGYRRTR